jgi:hypothetical protein
VKGQSVGAQSGEYELHPNGSFVFMWHGTLAERARVRPQYLLTAMETPEVDSLQSVVYTC